MSGSRVDFEHLSDAVRLSEEFLNRSSQLLDGTPLGVNIRHRQSTLYWQLAIEDGFAVALLVKNRHVQSARALIRPQIDALMRGAWFSCLATETEATSAVEHDCIPTSGNIRRQFQARKIEWRIGDEVVQIKDLFNPQLVSALHDHTHRGRSAIWRTYEARTKGRSLIANDEMQLLWMSTGASRIAISATLDQSDRGSHLAKFSSLCAEIFPQMLRLLMLEQKLPGIDE